MSTAGAESFRLPPLLSGGSMLSCFHCLATHGPFGLRQLAIDRVGHVDRPEGYVSKCDLCLHLRDQLHATGAFPELRPDGFYAEK